MELLLNNASIQVYILYSSGHIQVILKLIYTAIQSVYSLFISSIIL